MRSFLFQRVNFPKTVHQPVCASVCSLSTLNISPDLRRLIQNHAEAASQWIRAHIWMTSTRYELDCLVTRVHWKYSGPREHHVEIDERRTAHAIATNFAISPMIRYITLQQPHCLYEY